MKFAGFKVNVLALLRGTNFYYVHDIFSVCGYQIPFIEEYHIWFLKLFLKKYFNVL